MPYDQLKDINFIQNKTIHRAQFVSFGEKLVLLFTDRTMAVFNVVDNWGGDYEIEIDDSELELHEKRDLCFITEERYRTIMREREESTARERIKKEKKLLKELKQKYE